jgi:guanylate kinase
MVISEKQRGLLFVLVGPGGAGKNALMKEMLNRFDNLAKLVTATTRAPRPQEREGYDHYFVTLEEFQRKIAAGDLLEHQEVTQDKFYGILRAPVETALEAGKDLIADIEVLGAKILRETYPDDVVLIFVTVPGATDEDRLKTLEERMNHAERKEPDAVIQQRLIRARDLELPFAEQCDYQIVNEDNQMDKAAYELETKMRERRQERMTHEPEPVV